MKCQLCATDNPEDAGFCAECGRALNVTTMTAGAAASTNSVSQVTVDFPAAVKLGVKRYFDFKGRSSRAEYWWFALFILLAGIIAVAVGIIVPGLNALYELATLIPQIAIGVRRLHDINKTGWLMLLFLIPVFGGVVLIVWACRKGDEGDNSHGPDPRRTIAQ